MFLEKLKKMQKASQSMKSAEEIRIMDGAVNELYEKHLEENTIKVGDTLPDFNIIDTFGNSYTKESFKGKKLVLNFFRGSWCAFCNLEIGFLEEVQDEIESLGGKLISISPEKFNDDKKEEAKDAKSIITSDLDNQFARELGLVYRLTDELNNVYLKFGYDIEKINESAKRELPMPATIITNSEGVVTYIFAKADYTDRINPEEILEILK